VIAMLAVKANDLAKKKQKEAKLELYSLLSEGYKAMQESRESDINEVVKRIEQRRAKNV